MKDSILFELQIQNLQFLCQHDDWKVNNHGLTINFANKVHAFFWPGLVCKETTRWGPFTFSVYPEGHAVVFVVAVIRNECAIDVFPIVLKVEHACRPFPLTPRNEHPCQIRH